MNSKVIFLKIKDTQTKLQCISQLAHELVDQEKRLLITVPSEDAAKYIDSLLWKMPEERFLPHSIVSSPSKEFVAITLVKTQNFNQAHCLLNLCMEISPIFQQFEVVYELFDETEAKKMQQSQTKLQEYKSKGAKIVEVVK